MAPNVYFGFLQYENFAAIIIGTIINIYKCVGLLFKNNLLASDTVPLIDNAITFWEITIGVFLRSGNKSMPLFHIKKVWFLITGNFKSNFNYFISKFYSNA